MDKIAFIRLYERILEAHKSQRAYYEREIAVIRAGMKTRTYKEDTDEKYKKMIESEILILKYRINYEHKLIQKLEEQLKCIKE